MGKARDFIIGLKEGQKKFGETISVIVNLILIGFVYFVGVGLTSIFAKIFNKKFLNLEIDKTTDTYWQESNLTKKNKEEYYKQF